MKLILMRGLFKSRRISSHSFRPVLLLSGKWFSTRSTNGKLRRPQVHRELNPQTALHQRRLASRPPIVCGTLTDLPYWVLLAPRARQLQHQHLLDPSMSLVLVRSIAPTPTTIATPLRLSVLPLEIPIPLSQSPSISLS